MDIRIKEVMIQKGITSIKLANMIGVSTVTISNMLNHKTMPSLETLDKVAHALNVPLWQLFADPHELKEESPTEHSAPAITCPNCGHTIHLKVEE